jgi:WD40 repeat protein
MASGSADATVVIWDSESRQEVDKLVGHHGYVYSVAWRPDGRWLASGGADGVVMLWPLPGGRERIELHSRAGPVRSVAWSPNGQCIACGGGDLKIWDAASGKFIQSLRGHNAPITCVAWSPDSDVERQRLASVSMDGTLILWELATGQEVLTLRAKPAHPSQSGDKSPVFISVTWSPDGKRLVAGCDDGTVRIWEAD